MIKIVQPVIEDEEISGVIDVLKSGNIAQGPVTAEFEESFAQYCQASHAIATSNGTTALHAALYSLGIGQGDEVITSPFTFVATANSILMSGAKPAFADINPLTYTVDHNEVASAITKNTKAVMPVDLYGQPSDIDELTAVARKAGAFMVHDSCQAIGAEYKGKKVGSFADVSCFSLYATKNITTGEGGMITTNNPEVAELARQFRHHGQSAQRYEYLDLGYNYRITDIASAIGVAQLKKVGRFTEARRLNADYYNKALFNIDGLVTPTVAKDRTHVYHQYTLRVTEEFSMSRDELVAYLKDNGVAAGIYYPKALHLFPQFKDLGYKEGDFPHAEKASREVLSLPVHPLLKSSDRQKVIEIIKQAAKEKK